MDGGARPAVIAVPRLPPPRPSIRSLISHATSFPPSTPPPALIRAALLQRMSERMATGVDARDYSWLERALDQLKAARGVLAPTYPFAYIFFGEGRHCRRSGGRQGGG